MATHRSVAAKVRAEKEHHPERFCPDKRCLWRIVTALGTINCPRHMVTKPKPQSHAQAHSQPIVGCLMCEDALAEARESLDEWHVGT